MKKYDISEYKLNVRDLQIIRQALGKYEDSWREDLEELEKKYYRIANENNSIFPKEQIEESKEKIKAQIEYIRECIKEMVNTDLKVDMLISFSDCIDEDDKYCIGKNE